jgi:hypothetical protein
VYDVRATRHAQVNGKRESTWSLVLPLTYAITHHSQSNWLVLTQTVEQQKVMGNSTSPSMPSSLHLTPKNKKQLARNCCKYCTLPSVVIVHDKRGCLPVCAKHSEWRVYTSTIVGHDCTCLLFVPIPAAKCRPTASEIVSAQPLQRSHNLPVKYLSRF